MYDDLNRLTEDRVTAYPTGDNRFDPSVLAIVTAYSDRGQTASVTSYDSATARTDGNIVNQIVDAYNDWGQVSTSWQAHDGPVDNDGVGIDSPTVTYGYDTLARLASVTYPTTSRVVGYSYAGDTPIDNALSRVAAITDAIGGDPLAEYTYLGAGTVIKSERPQVGAGLSLDYGTHGNTGLDRFGRVVDQLWQTVGQNPTALDEYRYGYDPAGNRTKRENALADAASKNLSETYAYDELYRLIGTDRGHFVDGVFTNGTSYQDWTLDGLGNFAEFNDNGDVQNRTVNAANEIQTMTGGWVTPEYDAAGNMTAMPKPGEETTRLFAVYDAWNRLKKVYVDSDNDGNFEPSDTQSGSDLLLSTYEYDGLNRRIEKTTTADAPGGAREVDSFFNENWQLLESRTLTGSGQNANTAVDQYLWDISYIDAPVCRWHDANGDGDLHDTGDTIRYYTWDANFNVTAAFDGVYDSQSEQFVFASTPTDRYVYATYGAATVYNSDWSSTPVAPTTDGPLFAGYWLDTETGIYDVRMREYHSTLSTFVNPDPIEADPNTYRYCRDRATMATDPSGRETESYDDPTELLSKLDSFVKSNVGSEALAAVPGGGVVHTLAALGKEVLDAFKPDRDFNLGIKTEKREDGSTYVYVTAATKAKDLFHVALTQNIIPDVVQVGAEFSVGDMAVTGTNVYCIASNKKDISFVGFGQRGDPTDKANALRTRVTIKTKLELRTHKAIEVLTEAGAGLEVNTTTQLSIIPLPKGVGVIVMGNEEAKWWVKTADRSWSKVFYSKSYVYGGALKVEYNRHAFPPITITWTEIPVPLPPVDPVLPLPEYNWGAKPLPPSGADIVWPDLGPFPSVVKPPPSIEPLPPVR